LVVVLYILLQSGNGFQESRFGEKLVEKIRNFLIHMNYGIVQN
jgi:hypothetical protein